MHVSIYQPQGPSHTFDEIAETLRYGLKALAATGFPVPPNKTLILGAHLMPWDLKPTDQRILYNFEQHDSPLLNNSVLHVYRQHEVWDYSASNVAWLKERGIAAKHVPLGYVPELQRIALFGRLPIGYTEPPAQQDIDVLFYGLVNTRRRRILDDLKAAGLKVHEAINCYGQERDTLIGRSKIVLNMHFYETGIFEIVRCSYLFTNAVCVVSEESVDVPPELVGAVPFASYSSLVDTCLHVVRNGWTAEWATKAHEAFRSCDEASILRIALNESGSR